MAAQPRRVARPSPAPEEPDRPPERAPDPPVREAVLAALGEGEDVRVRLRAGGAEVRARLPQHVSRAWLAAALERGPLEVALARTDVGRWVLWSVFPGPEHAEVEAAEVEIRGSAVRLRGTRSVEIACGSSRVALKEDGEVRVRGREILSRASGVNRIKGGAVRIN